MPAEWADTVYCEAQVRATGRPRGHAPHKRSGIEMWTTAHCTACLVCCRIMGNTRLFAQLLAKSLSDVSSLSLPQRSGVLPVSRAMQRDAGGSGRVHFRRSSTPRRPPSSYQVLSSVIEYYRVTSSYQILSNIIKTYQVQVSFTRSPLLV